MSKNTIAKTMTMPSSTEASMGTDKTLPQAARHHRVQITEIATLLYTRGLALSVQKPGDYFVALLTSPHDGKRVALGCGNSPDEAMANVMEDYVAKGTRR